MVEWRSVEGPSGVLEAVTPDARRKATLAEAVRIRVVRNFEEFLAIADRWHALLKETASYSVFLTWEWLYTWSRHYL